MLYAPIGNTGFDPYMDDSYIINQQTGKAEKNPYSGMTASDIVNQWSQGSYIQTLMKEASNGDAGARDKLSDWFMTLDLMQRQNEYTAQREDTAYDRLMAQLKRNGISPYLLTGVSPMAQQANATTISGSQFTSAENSRRSKKASDTGHVTNVIGSIMGLIGSALMALAIFA